jgi:hypothetical protein
MQRSAIARAAAARGATIGHWRAEKGSAKTMDRVEVQQRLLATRVLDTCEAVGCTCAGSTVHAHRHRRHADTVGEGPLLLRRAERLSARPAHVSDVKEINWLALRGVTRAFRVSRPSGEESGEGRSKEWGGFGLPVASA